MVKWTKTAMATEGSALYSPEWAEIAKKDRGFQGFLWAEIIFFELFFLLMVVVFHELFSSAPPAVDAGAVQEEGCRCR